MKIACAYNAFYIEKAHANFITIKKQINSDENSMRLQCFLY